MLSSSRVLSRTSWISGVRRPLLLLSPASSKQHHHFIPAIWNGVHPIVHNPDHVSKFHHSAYNSFLFQNFGFASAASSEQADKEEGARESNGQGETNGDVESGAPAQEAGFSSESQATESQPVRRRRKGAKRTAFSVDDAANLSRDDLLKLVVEKDELLKSKQEEFEMMKDKFLRSLAENENVMERTKREAENSKKFAIQNFAKGLLDVADNLERASSVFKESFAKIDTSKDSSGVVQLVKSLSEGVDMTEKQLGEVFKKFGLEKFDPTNEPFDPHKHNAASKPPGTVAHVLKTGYMLHERVVRPAEVGVTQGVENV
ncbi:GrpE protein homolog 2, mitochondrial [Linum grandiflorum]